MNENVSAKRLLSGLAATLLVASCATSAAGTPSPLAATSAATPGPTAVRAAGDRRLPRHLLHPAAPAR